MKSRPTPGRVKSNTCTAIVAGTKMASSPVMKNKKARTIRREITMSVLMPVTVTFTCAAVTDHEGEDDLDWTVESVRRADVETPSPRALTECMRDEEHDYMHELIAAAGDLP